MKIKIFKDENLFDHNGHHICDASGFAIKATEDTECEIDDMHADRVLLIVQQERQLKEDMKKVPQTHMEEMEIPELPIMQPTQESAQQQTQPTQEASPSQPSSNIDGATDFDSLV